MRCRSIAVQNHACSVVHFFKEKITKYANVKASPDPLPTMFALVTKSQTTLTPMCANVICEWPQYQR